MKIGDFVKFVPEDISSLMIFAECDTVTTQASFNIDFKCNDDVTFPDGIDTIYIVYKNITREIVTQKYDPIRQAFTAEAGVSYRFSASEINSWRNVGVRGQLEIET